MVNYGYVSNETNEPGVPEAVDTRKQMAESILKEHNVKPEDYEKVADEIFKMVPKNVKSKFKTKWDEVLSYGSIYFGE